MCSLMFLHLPPACPQWPRLQREGFAQRRMTDLKNRPLHNGPSSGSKRKLAAACWLSVFFTACICECWWLADSVTSVVQLCSL